MSPRAACRLEAFGFERVYDYVLGIADWKAAGLPVDGEGPRIQTVADAMRPDVPTCGRSEPIGQVRARVTEAGWDDCLVIDCDSLVIGRLRSSSWGLDGHLSAEEVMQPGPSTVRPDGPLDRLVEQMDRRPTPLVTVTTPQGALLGVVLRDDAHRLLEGEPPEMVWAECEGCPGQWRPVG
jgi:hypothetical protein